jgi:beta-galactosidase
MDMFREPKFAAYAYASQCEPSDEIILKPVTFWARGERNIGGVLPLIVLTNCEEIELQYGDHKPKMIKPDRERFPNLPNAPVIIDRRHFSEDELGLWGMKWEDAVFTGYIDGRPAIEQRFTSEPVPTVLEVKADMAEIDMKSVVRVIVRVLDQAGNKLPFFPEPVTIDVSGAGRRIGPRVVPLRAGSTGFWVQSEDNGLIKLSVSHDRLGTVDQKIQVRLGVDNEPS